MSKSLRVAVTGASGKIGSFVVRELMSRGHDVLAVDRVINLATKARFVLADLRQREQVYQVLSQVEAVVHLGELPHAARAATLEDVWADNTRSSGFVLHMAADLKLRRVVYASSAQVYGFVHGSWPTQNMPVALKLPFDESQPLVPNNPYAAGKVAIETYAAMSSRISGLSVALLRLPGVLTLDLDGTGDGFSVRQLRFGGPRDVYASIVHCADVAKAFALALEQEHPGCEAYNVASDQLFIGESIHEHLAKHHPSAPALPADWPADRAVMLSEKFKSHFGWKAEIDLAKLRVAALARMEGR